MGQDEPSRVGSTICYGQELARKCHQDSAVRFVTAKRGPEGATKTRVGQKKSPQDSAVRFVVAKSWPERATENRQYDFLRPRVVQKTTKTRQYDLLRPRVVQKEPPRLGIRFVEAKVGQKEPPRLGSTVCYGQQKEPPRLGSTICYGQTWARKSHRDSAIRFVTAKSWPEKATKTRQYDLLRPNVGQKEPPRLGSTICYGQTWARKSHQDSAVRFVTAKSWPERATKTRQYDLLRPRVGQKKPPRLGSAICYDQELARESHQDLAVRFVAANRESHRDSAVRFVTAKSWPERATKTRQYDLLRPRVGQKEPPRLGSTICYGQELARKSHQDSAIRFVTAKRGPERATETRQYDLSRPRVGQKETPRLDSTICYGQTWARKSHQDSAIRFVTAKRGPERATLQFATAKTWQERATKTRQYDLLRPNMCQKEPPRLGFITANSWPERATETRHCYLLFVTAKSLARKSHQDSAVRFIMAKRVPGQKLARKSHQDSAVRFVTAKNWSERATKTRQYDLLRPRVGQKEPPRLGSTICYGQTRARKSHQDSAVRFVTAKNWPERATKTRQYDLLRPRVGQKEPPRLGSTICYGQELARKSHQDSAVRFVTAKRGSERATKTRQYDLLRPRVGQKKPPRLGSTIYYGQTWARKSHQDSAVRFVTAKSWPE